jgi:sporulation protein YlmC with PRC-barrel domain
MSQRDELDLGLRVLDQQVVDWAGIRCGRVDDVEFDGEPGKQATLRALVVGAPARAKRAPRLLRFLPRFTRGFGDDLEVEIPWSDVEDVTQVVKLKREASELGLARGDERARRWLERIPGS